MTLADLLRETLDVDCEDVWENERTSTPVRMFGVRLHSVGYRFEKSSLYLIYSASTALMERYGIGHRHFRKLKATRRRRVAVEEKQIKVAGEEKWLYAAIDTESKLLLEIDVYSRRGTDPAALTRRKRLVCQPDISDFW